MPASDHRLKRSGTQVISALCIVSLTAFPILLRAQRIQTRVPNTNIPATVEQQQEETPNANITNARPPSLNKLHAKTCMLSPFPGMENTVSVSGLRVPEKAQREYEKACEAMRDQKMPEIEAHLRKAVEIYPAYAEGWTMLGKILEGQGRIAEAKDACARAAEADASHWAAYLCLAEIAGHEQNWDEVLDKTSHAIELNPAAKSYAYMFEAIALFNLDRLPEAESRANEAELMDQTHQQPILQLLLARINEANGDDAAAVDHLRKFLQYSKDSPASDSAKQDLARLEAEAKPSDSN